VVAEKTDLTMQVVEAVALEEQALQVMVLAEETEVLEQYRIFRVLLQLTLPVPEVLVQLIIINLAVQALLEFQEVE
jgi:hypothetical protein